MSQSSLTAKYRPQRFEDVAGQETVKAILSRAALEDKVAPAYLFSGTRGVGKTTIARILAKALNCATAPTAEPCNQCAQCRQITQGVAVDVIEIDGASNRGIEDAKRIKEDIGYAPMEGRYKVFIIDEAHMLTREAFNALLKTLEEPPGNATFILATTEPHKFPPTIISRCQHFAFKRLTAVEIEAHLQRILGMEGIDAEAAAVKLLARRAAGSVRDSMSLLGQVLALGRSTLTMDDVRKVLGLAGQEVFFRIMAAVRDADCATLTTTLSEIFDQGLDLGFFLRELAAVWRNLFLLKQTGEAALPLLELPDEEGRLWLEWAPQFTMGHIHACWQLTLEGQRRVLTSLEPALSLELLLLNLAFLPKLISLEKTCTPQGGPTGNAPARGPVASAPPRGSTPPSGGSADHRPPSGGPSGKPGSGGFGGSGRGPFDGPQSAQPARPAPAPAQQAPPPAAVQAQSPEPPWAIETENAAPQPARPSGPAQRPGRSAHGQSTPPPGVMKPDTKGPDPAGPDASGPAGRTAQDNAAPAFPPPPPGPRTWEGFAKYLAACSRATGQTIGGLQGISGDYEGQKLELRCLNELHCERMLAKESMDMLTPLAEAFFGPEVRIAVKGPAERTLTMAEIKQEVQEHPMVKAMQKEFGAAMLNHEPLHGLPGARKGNGKP